MSRKQLHDLKRDYLVMCRFQNRHRAVIEQVAKESGLTASEFVRRCVWDHVKHKLAADASPLKLPLDG